MKPTNFLSPIFRLPLSLMLICLFAATAHAQATISDPANNQQVSSPFNLTMNAAYCSSIPVSAVGYSLDNSTSTATFAGQTMNGPVSAPLGWHTVHVKVWNNKGGVCVTDVSVDVVTSGGASVVPSSATRIGSIQTMGNWTAIHDGGTPGSSSGSMSISGSPSLTGSARLYANQFNNYGGERYSSQYDGTNAAQNYFYDAWVYIAGDSNGFSNLEFDLNHTMSNGETVIMGFQCDTWSGTWDYAVNGGSPTAPSDTWLHSYAKCNVHSWAPNAWHHVQIYFSHAENGWVTYHSVWLDGVEQDLNNTVFSGYMLGWAPTVVTNFQIDGNSSGTTWGNVYIDELTVSSW